MRTVAFVKSACGTLALACSIATTACQQGAVTVESNSNATATNTTTVTTNTNTNAATSTTAFEAREPDRYRATVGQATRPSAAHTGRARWRQPPLQRHAAVARRSHLSGSRRQALPRPHGAQAVRRVGAADDRLRRALADAGADGRLLAATARCRARGRRHSERAQRRQVSLRRDRAYDHDRRRGARGQLHLRGQGHGVAFEGRRLRAVHGQRARCQQRPPRRRDARLADGC